MAYKQGETGNPTGRPRESAEHKKAKDLFIKELKKYSPTALKNILEIASDNRLSNKDRFKANEYILNHTFGNNFVALDEDNQEHLVIKIVRHIDEQSNNDWE